MQFFFGLILVIFGVITFIGGVIDSQMPPSQRMRREFAARIRANQPQQRPGAGRATRQAYKGKPGLFAQAQLGQQVLFNHPKAGKLHGTIAGTIKYTELWQRHKSPNEPWVPTGNTFTAHWLGDRLLYEWKGNLWVFDEHDDVTDARIKSNFLPAAHEFGKSDETARVNFAYPPGSWLITDIGKFRVERTEGTGLRMDPGAVGRFIHAEGGTGLEGRGLAVEDYLEGGGGKDTVWTGWQLRWEDLYKIGD